MLPLIQLHPTTTTYSCIWYSIHYWLDPALLQSTTRLIQMGEHLSIFISLSLPETMTKWLSNLFFLKNCVWGWVWRGGEALFIPLFLVFLLLLWICFAVCCSFLFPHVWVPHGTSLSLLLGSLNSLTCDAKHKFQWIERPTLCWCPPNWFIQTPCLDSFFACRHDLSKTIYQRSFKSYVQIIIYSSSYTHLTCRPLAHTTIIFGLDPTRSI